MKPFSTIAIPHRDILEGRLTMDVFAADLWEVFKERAPDEYQDPQVFFRKTYITKGLENLLKVAEKRLKGEGEDPVIQLQTPFGGGKTHALIALYHKAKEWNANVIVIDGTALDPKDITLWEEMEKQIKSEVSILAGQTAPGREKLRMLLERYQPLIVLIDEVLQYTTKAAGIKVGDSNLASQVLAFIQELTGTIKTLDKCLLILTLPSSVLEHYDEAAERLFQQLQKIAGRMEKVYTPVEEAEIYQVIRRRLFSSIDENEARKIIELFLDYAQREKILPEDIEPADYRKKFIKSYPFQPEVIDILYKRWGSFPTFQRTRGVLRLLSLVVHSLKDAKNPFIRLSDFDLKNDEIKRELIKHIGQEYDSVIAQDITSASSGAKKVDMALGDAYMSFSFGTRVATSIFMYSFSGGPERGATMNEIKLSSVDLSVPGSIVVEAVSKLKETLFYLQSDGRFFFTNQPNINRILLTKMETVEYDLLRNEEKKLLAANLKKEHFGIFLWPKASKDIPDTKELKLVILQSQDNERCRELLENYGERPRIYCNTLIFLCPMDSERRGFEEFLKRKLAWQAIEKDKSLHLTDAQKKDVRGNIREAEADSKEYIRNLYRLVFVPAKKGFREIDLGRLAYGIDIGFDKEIYERLRNEGEILAKLEPLTIRERYLKDKEFAETKKILESFYKTPGEIRIISDELLKDAIRDGVRKGLFGIGDIGKEKPICRYFMTDCSPTLVEGEVLIKAELCKLKEPRKGIEIGIKKKGGELEGPVTPPPKGGYQNLNLRLNVPSGKLSDIVRMVSYLKTKFDQVDIRIEIATRGGEIPNSDYEDKIKEAINQANIIIEKEEIK